ncbi:MULTISPECIES: hypothetical protein [Streptomyces]|uniref:Uncharacterized protein n=1 Tax=Streptomyces flaveolus TaxID=67297 RepID=A0ABV3AFD9_9ACTN|nr:MULTISPECIES: hypothetical protein [Streptomyces]
MGGLITGFCARHAGRARVYGQMRAADSVSRAGEELDTAISDLRPLLAS